MLFNDIIEIRKIEWDSDFEIESPNNNNKPLDLNFGLRVLKVTKLKMIDAGFKFSGLLYGCRTKII